MLSLSLSCSVLVNSFLVVGSRRYPSGTRAFVVVVVVVGGGGGGGGPRAVCLPMEARGLQRSYYSSVE